MTGTEINRRRLHFNKLMPRDLGNTMLGENAFTLMMTYKGQTISNTVFCHGDEEDFSVVRYNSDMHAARQLFFKRR